MLFNSTAYALFLPVVVVLAWLLHRQSWWRSAMLLAASYAFYMNWNWRYAGLLLASTVVDYAIGHALGRTTGVAWRRLLLGTSVATNLGVLVFFKYAGFFLQSGTSVLQSAGLPALGIDLDFLLPVGISFYTFQSMSYTIDVYRGALTPTRSFLNFAVFVSFFPQLVAGPIVRAKHFLPQLARRPVFDARQVELGLFLILVGLWKKVALADLLAATLVDQAFADPGSCSGWQLWLASYGYAFQIYCDFSGYSDVAIGSAALLGFTLPVNFDRPFCATSLRDFWHRWHISLSSWLRDYLYIPLGGSRRGKGRTYVNLAATMVLGGLWHGAAWTFVIWGAIHGVYLGIERALRLARDPAECTWAGRFVRRVIVFHLVVGAFMVFRAPDLATVGTFVQGMVRGQAGSWVTPPLFYAVLLIAAASHWLPRALPRGLMKTFTALPSGVQGGVIAVSVIGFAILSRPDAAFIYFQF